MLVCFTLTLTSTTVMECRRLFSTPTGFLLSLFTDMVRASSQVLNPIRSLAKKSPPGTGSDDEVGKGEGLGYSVNVPLLEGLTDEGYRQLFGPVLNEVGSRQRLGFPT